MFYVVTLYSGENEYSKCKASARMQTVGCDHETISGLDNIQAHKEIYNRFSNAEKKYSYMCKLDADMVFEDSNVLKDVSLYFDENPNVDHIVIPVRDYYTDKHIIGIHFFRFGVYWKNNEDKYFVDHSPIIKGKKVVLPWMNRITHCSDPKDKQSFLFGVHRATKLIEAVKTKNLVQVISQSDTLFSLIKHHSKKPYDVNLNLALYGVRDVLDKKVNHKDYSQKDSFNYTSQLNGKVDGNKLKSSVNLIFNDLSFYEKFKVKFRLIASVVLKSIRGY